MENRLRIRPGIAEWREIDDEIVGIDTRTATYFALNRTGAVLWEDLLAGATRESLVDKLQQEYGLDPDAAVRDVEAFIRSLADQDILEPAA
jgi:hypothetical protein